MLRTNACILVFDVEGVFCKGSNTPLGLRVLSQMAAMNLHFQLELMLSRARVGYGLGYGTSQFVCESIL